MNYLSYTTRTIFLELRITRKFGLEINIGLKGIQIQCDKGTDE